MFRQPALLQKPIYLHGHEFPSCNLCTTRSDVFNITWWRSKEKETAEVKNININFACRATRQHYYIPLIFEATVYWINLPFDRNITRLRYSKWFSATPTAAWNSFLRSISILLELWMFLTSSCLGWDWKTYISVWWKNEIITIL